MRITSHFILTVVAAATVTFSGGAPVCADRAWEAVDGRVYNVGVIEYRLVHEFPEIMRELDRLDVEIALGEHPDDPGAYVRPRPPDVPAENEWLSDLTPARLYASAIEVVVEGVRDELERAFGSRFHVAVDERDIDPHTGRDLRPADRTALGLRIEYTGDIHQIDGFQLRYLYPGLAGQPEVDELTQVPVTLVRAQDAQGEYYTAWRAGQPATTLTLAEIRERPVERYSSAAVQQVLLAVRDRLVEHRLMGVIVQPDERALGESREPGGRPQVVELVIVTGVVGELRTLASGDRIPEADDVARMPGVLRGLASFAAGTPLREQDDRVNHPGHRRIRERSPIQVGDLLHRDVMERYIYRLNRHPGRRVDIAIAPSEEIVHADAAAEGVARPTLALDYIISENRPLLLYVQGSNTGTRHTGRWRQRFGLYHSQLTGNDDIFNIDYNTAGFSDSHIVTGSYDARFFDMEHVRWRIFGTWSEFHAADVGIPGLDFTGESWGIGGEIALNILQHRKLFVDVVGGARYLDVEVGTFFFQIPFGGGKEQFFFPYTGLRLERIDETAITRAMATVEWQVPGVTGASRQEMGRLGRPDPDRDWVTLQWDLFQSFYLEPLLNPAGWGDPATPETSTLAHEIAVGFRGQHAFGSRLIPQSTMIAGGLYTVRGYPESIVSGDTVLLGTVEYRFHLPRLFSPADPGQFLGDSFRWTPQHVYGRPDWDLIFRGFFDIGHVIQNRPQAFFETDETLMGAGVGVEFQFKRNLNVRVDWGVALEGLEGRVRSGSSRVHFIGTLLF